MGLKDRIQRLEKREGPGCIYCRDWTIPIIEVTHRDGRPYFADQPKPLPKACPVCGREREITSLIIELGPPEEENEPRTSH